MPAISVGSVEVDVVPNTQGIYNHLRAALVPAATRAGQNAGDAAGRAFGPAMQGQIGNLGLQIGQQIGQQIAGRVTAALRNSVRNGLTQAGQTARPAAARQGEETGGAFARSLRVKLQEAFRSMPKLDVSLADTGVDAELARLRARMETLSNKRIGVDVDVATADAEVADIEERLRRLGASHPNVAVRSDTAAARAALAGLREEIARVTADPARIRVETDGGLGTRLRAAVEQAEASLPNVNVGADTTPAQAEIASLRAQLTALRDQRVGIDIDAATALARIEEIQARLARLSAQDADVAVRVDAGAAAAQLAAFQAAVNALDGRNVDIDTGSSAAGFNALTAAAITFGPAILPVLPVVAAGLGAVAAAGTAAAAGIGSVALVAVPAFKQIGTVLQAQKAAQDAATNATYSGGKANSQGASKALQMAGAQQALATAERNGAQQIAQAQAQVKQAKQGVADAISQAAQRTKQAEQQVEEAERSLAQAQKDEKQAQLDLTAARKEASRQLEDMNNQLVDSQLSLRDAQLRVTEAQQNLNAVLANPKASQLQRAQAQLAFDEAQQHLKEQQTQTKRLQSDTAAANKAGVDGSQTVKDAQDRLASAQDNVADRTRALQDAQANQAKVAQENSRQIAQAQQRVADAQNSVAVAQQNAADSVASAQRQIASASQSAAGGVDQAAVAQAKYQAALAKLTPSARDTLNAFLDLRSAFGAWSRSLQPAVMPIFTRALVSLRNTLPTLTPFVKGAASAIKELQDRASAQVKTPFWQGFKKDLQTSVKPAIVGLGVAFGNVVKGMAGVVDAFLPHMDGISSTMQRITKKFASWGANLKGSPEFERFLSYASDKAPMLADVLGSLFDAFLSVSTALAPLSSVIFAVVTPVLDGLAWLGDNAPEIIQVLWGLYVVNKAIALGMRAYGVAMGIYNTVTALATVETWSWAAAIQATGIVPLIELIVVAIVALGLAVYEAYQHVGWFRAAVDAAWAGIKTATLWLWQSVLQPAFHGIWVALQAVGTAAMWLWNNAIKPAWHFISAAARILLAVVVVAVLLPIVAMFKVTAAVAMWLWNNAIKPAFHFIASLSVWLYKSAIKPSFDLMMTVFRALGRVGTWLYKSAISPAFHGLAIAAKWLYTNGIKPAFGWIADRAEWVWHKGVKPAFDGLKAGVKAVSGAFKTAKDYIGEQWGKVSALARKPVQYVVDVVYNSGVRGVWNKVADAFGAPKLPKFKFASGGIMPGYTPGRDVHQFVSPTGGRLELSGGEAIMRPEFTRAVGSGFVGSMNAIARSRGAEGVKAALAPLLGGNPVTPTDRSLPYANGGVVQSFKDGGIFGWIGKGLSKVAGAGSDVWNAVKKTASWLGDTLEASARAGVKHVVDPLLKSFPGMDTGFGKLIRHIPTKVIDALFGYSKKADDKGAGGIGGPRIQAALKWAKTQAGKPYQWAGNGNPSWDCSGFMSAIESVIRGQKPHRRWATMAFSGKTAPPGWVYHGNSAFKIGITNAGVGHTAGTLGKTHVESRGGDGVVVGSRARGYNDRLFGSWYGFKPGTYDSGGYLQPGMNLAFNGTGKPEPVFTTAQANALQSLAARSAQQQLGDLSVAVYVGNQQITDIARAEVRTAQGELIQVLNAS